MPGEGEVVDEVSTVYGHVTGRAITEPGTKAFEVLRAHGGAFAARDAVAQDLRAFVRDASDLNGLRGLVADYARNLDPEGEVA